MLEARGNPDTRDEFGRPMILMHWYLGYYNNQARSRLELLLDRGADVNSAMPADEWDSAGYSLLLYRTKMGLDDSLAYADSLLLLERGADPNRAGADGMTFGKMLMDHRAHFQQTRKRPPADFAALLTTHENLRASYYSRATGREPTAILAFVATLRHRQCRAKFTMPQPAAKSAPLIGHHGLPLIFFR